MRSDTGWYKSSEKLCNNLKAIKLKQKFFVTKQNYLKEDNQMILVFDIFKAYEKDI